MYGSTHMENCLCLLMPISLVQIHWALMLKTLAIPCLQNLLASNTEHVSFFQGSEDEIDMAAKFIYWSIYIFISFCSDTISRLYKATRPLLIALIAAPCRLPEVVSHR